jgi:hypothetical protein
MLDGWKSIRDARELLIEAVACNITTDDYKTRVITSVAARGRRH